MDKVEYIKKINSIIEKVNDKDLYKLLNIHLDL